jgi:hypothetical protein
LRHKVRTLQQGEVDGHYDVVLLACKAYDLPVQWMPSHRRSATAPRSCRC